MLINYDRLFDIGRQQQAAFQSAKPFPNVMIDDFFEPEVYAEIASAFPNPGHAIWKRPENVHTKGKSVTKRGAHDLKELLYDEAARRVFFELNSSDLAAAGQKVLDDNAALLKRYPTWTVTIEGHCDERGTAEYNLALGERRAIAARAYLVSLGISADRLRTVSYGKEFPFDPGHDESAYAKNRRAHFVITAK